MKKLLLYTSAIMLSAIIMNHDLSLNYKTDLNKSLTDLNTQTSVSEVVATSLGHSYGACGAVNMKICWVIEFGDGYYWYGWGKP